MGIVGHRQAYPALTGEFGDAHVVVLRRRISVQTRTRTALDQSVCFGPPQILDGLFGRRAGVQSMGRGRPQAAAHPPQAQAPRAGTAGAPL